MKHINLLIIALITSFSINACGNNDKKIETKKPAETTMKCEAGKCSGAKETKK